MLLFWRVRQSIETIDWDFLENSGLYINTGTCSTQKIGKSVLIVASINPSWTVTSNLYKKISTHPIVLKLCSFFYDIFVCKKSYLVLGNSSVWRHLKRCCIENQNFYWKSDFQPGLKGLKIPLNMKNDWNLHR